jgi:ABC-type antimicrobial peptide transport system permease subunit
MFARRAQRSIKANSVSILGLGIAMTLTIFTISYTIFELSYDHYHEGSELVYIVRSDIEFESGRYTQSYSTSHLLKSYISNRISYIDLSCRTRNEKDILKSGEIKVNNTIAIYTDPEFFDMLDYELLYGSTGRLKEPGNAILTQSFSKKISGDNSALGKTIMFRNNIYSVRGIIKDPPENTNFEFDIILPVSDYLKEHEGSQNYTPVKTYLRFRSKPGDISTTEHLLSAFYSETGNTSTKCSIYPLHKLHQQIHNTKKNIALLISISILILVIACINYINMLSAYYNNGIKEMGIRKSFGGSKGSLVRNVLIDSLMCIIVSTIIGLIIMAFLKNNFAVLTGLIISDHSRGTGLIYFLIPALVILISITTGLLAARKYYSIGTSEMLANCNKSPEKLGLRKFLLLIQFTISTGMIIIFLILMKQVNYINDYDPGFETSNRLLVRLNRKLAFSYDSFMDELYKIPGAISVTGKFSPFGRDYGADISTEKDSKDKMISATGYCVQDNFFRTYGIEIINGNSFADIPGKDSSLFIIDAYTADLLDLNQPVGSRLKDDFIWGTIIGVAENTTMVPLRGERKPVIYNQIKDICTELTIYHQGNEKLIAESVSDKLKEYDSEYEPGFSSMEEAINELYNKEKQTVKLIMWSGLIAVLLSLSGVYSLTSYITGRSLKQMAIKRILGGPADKLILSSLVNISKLILFSVIISYPLSYLVISEWLKGFSVKAKIGIFPYLFATLSVCLLSLLIVYLKNRLVLSANPADVLRNE